MSVFNIGRNEFQPLPQEPEQPKPFIKPPFETVAETSKRADNQYAASNAKYQIAATFDNKLSLPNVAPDLLTVLNDINKLPRPDRSDPQSVIDYNNRRADLAAGALKRAKPPTREDYRTLPAKTADYELTIAKNNYDTVITQLKTAANARGSKVPPPINSAEADRTARNLIDQYDAGKSSKNAFELGQKLGELAKRNPADAAAILSRAEARLKSTEFGDNAATGFVDSLNDGELAHLAKAPAGKQMLLELKGHLSSGNVHENEKRQIERIDQFTLSSAQKIAAAQQEIEKVYQKNPQDYAAIAKIVRIQAEKLSPGDAAALLQKIKPQVAPVVKRLIEAAVDADGSYDRDYANTKNFDAALADLSRAFSRAAQSPQGKALISELAKPIVEYIKKNGVARFDEALGKTIAQGGGAELAVEVMTQLKAAGKASEADDILQNVRDGFNELKGNLKNKLEAYGKANAELSWLIQKWGPLMSPDKLELAIARYQNRHPELQDKFNALNNLSAAAVRTLNTLSTLPDSLKSLDHYKDSQAAVKDLLSDKTTQKLITTMPGAAAEFEKLYEAQSEGQPTVLDKIHQFIEDHSIGDYKEFGENMAAVLLKSSVNSAIKASLNGDPAKMNKLLGNLGKYSRLLGVSQEKLDEIVRDLRALPNGGSPAAAQARLKLLNNDLDGPFAANTNLGRVFRGAGVLLALSGLPDSFENIKDFQTATRTLTDVVGLGQSSAELLSGIITSTKLTSVIESGAFKTLGGRILPVVSIGLDTLSLIKDATGKNRDYANAGFDLAGIGGGITLLAAGGPAGIAIGAVLVLGSAIGKTIYGKVKESNIHENMTTEIFLRDGGVKSSITRNLRNNGSDGDSAGPVLTALAKYLHVQPHEFLKYLNTLSPDKVEQLVAAAVGVDADKNGNYPVDIHIQLENRPHDLKQLAQWMKDHGFDAPGI